jgi:hypothetical protein
VNGYPPHLLTDRTLWDHFCEIGFVRQIECRGPTGYIQFDTEGDALEAFDAMDEARVEEAVIQVDIVEDRVLNLPNVVIPLTAVEREEPQVPPRPREPRPGRMQGRQDSRQRRPHPEKREDRRGGRPQEDRPRVRDYERSVV